MERTYRYPVNRFELNNSSITIEELKDEFIKRTKENFIKDYNINPETIKLDIGLQDNFIDGCTYIYVDIKGEENAE